MQYKSWAIYCIIIVSTCISIILMYINSDCWPTLSGHNEGVIVKDNTKGLETMEKGITSLSLTHIHTHLTGPLMPAPSFCVQFMLYSSRMDVSCWEGDKTKNKPDVWNDNRENIFYVGLNYISKQRVVCKCNKRSMLRSRIVVIVTGLIMGFHWYGHLCCTPNLLLCRLCSK